MKLIYNGHPLDDMVPGYTTANVEGRGILSRSLSTVPIPGRDGEYILDQKLPARVLTVQYMMTSDSSLEFLDNMNYLHDLLHTDEDVKIQFTDELYYRMGRLSDSDPPPYDFYRGFGYFQLFCQDPYKYMWKPPITGTSLVPTSGSSHHMKIESITATLTANRSGFEIKNITTGRIIKLTGAFYAGETLVIKPDEGILTSYGQNAMGRLDFMASDWHDFKIFGGNQITAPQAITLNLTERKL